MRRRPAPDPDFVLSYTGLKITTGLVGLLMPWAVRLGGFLTEGITVSGTVSAYYYTGMRDVFVGTLAVVGALLASYRTPRRLDNAAALVAGLAAVAIGLFPMRPVFAVNIARRYRIPDDLDAYFRQVYFPHGPLGWHTPAVALFFGAGLYLVAVSFRETSRLEAEEGVREVTWQKVARNRLYLTSAITMLLAGLTIAALQLLGWRDLIFWPESVAISAFAFAWLVKGQLVLADGPPDTPKARRRERWRVWALLALPTLLCLLGWVLTVQAPGRGELRPAATVGPTSLVRELADVGQRLSVDSGG